MSSAEQPRPKPHVCPPSTAQHPSDRWETLFVYSFICKFTELRKKVAGLESAMDLEEALMSKEPNSIITQVLVQFVINLKPQTRNLSADQISTTVASVLAEYFKTPERTPFWDDSLEANIDPFPRLEGGFFTTDWEFKLKILRLLVELQLSHSAEIKAVIDRAWGVVHNKHKKGHQPQVEDGITQEDLQLVPIGQDIDRKRFWIADDSPRVYVSTNPWKTTATFQSICSTKEEYLALIDQLKQSTPVTKGRRSKLETLHVKLIDYLESRLEAIDAELARIARARKKIEQKRALLAQAELRQTRTRRQTQRPDYAYTGFDEEDDGADDYQYQEEEYGEEEYDQDSQDGGRRGRHAPAVGSRRSTRRAAANDTSKRERSSDSTLWRGERRSSRLVGLDSDSFEDQHRKRARTEESVTSGDASVETNKPTDGPVKSQGAAALKPGETALEVLPGKKKSRFWMYAVEPIPNNGGTNGVLHAQEASRPSPEPERQERMDVEMGSQPMVTPVHRSFARTVFRFRGCLHHRRRLTTNVLPPTTDDKDLVTLFDQPSSGFRASPLAPTGLFEHPSLTTPAALVSLADATLVRARLLTDRILRARESRTELLKVVKNLDRLSDMLCGVIDLAELVRNAHPERMWAEAANQAYESLCEFMNVLNTDVRLYEVLKSVLSDPAIVKTLSPEAYQTALIFWRDFEKSAIDLPPAERAKFVSLSSDILVLGRQFLENANTPRPPTAIKPSELAGLKDKGLGVRLQLQARFTQRDLLVYPGSLQAQMIMRSAPEEEPRRRVYLAANSSTPEQLNVLETLLRKRAELAQLVGRQSFAHMTLDDKMAKTPDNVYNFIDALLKHTRPFARRALETLAHRKQAHHGLSSLPIVQAWDRDFYCPPEPPAPPIALPPLTLGTVFMGLSRLFQHLYGISLRPTASAYGEVWHSDVHKLEVVDQDKGVIGWIYADLFARHGKASGAAHYTVRCSRRTDDDDVEGDGTIPGQGAWIQESLDFEVVKRHRLPNQDGVFQLPLVVLLCEFARPTRASGPTVLEWHEVVTLFHEMGHAMHSMIGRTEYQNVAGTRCATDFVELPSILMEHFLNSSAVLSLFDKEDSSTPRQIGNHHSDPCHSIDTYTQILLAAVDQVYHSPAVLNPSFDSTAELAKLHDMRGLIPHVPGTSFQTQFGHLFGYGATYYSYLFDRAIASRVWRNVFSADPLSRETGEKYKREVLQFGGGKDPWAMVSALLDAPELASGNAEAMREVGRWKIEDDVGQPGRH